MTALTSVNDGLPAAQAFGSNEAHAAIDVMMDSNEVLLSDDVLYKI